MWQYVMNYKKNYKEDYADILMHWAWLLSIKGCKHFKQRGAKKRKVIQF